MSTFIKIGLGVAIAVIIPFMVWLGIEAFYPSPKDPYEKCRSFEPIQKENQKVQIDPMQKPEYKKCFEEADATLKTYNRNLFAATSVIGFLAIATGALLFGSTLISETVGPVAPGLVFGGIITIWYGVARGFDAVDKKWLFAEMVAILIGLILVTIRYLRRSEKAKSV